MKKLKDILAQVASRVLDPVWEIPLAILLAVAFAVKEGLRWRSLGLVLFIDALLPLVFYLVLLWNKQLSAWDMPKRSERMPLYIFSLLCHMVGLWVVYSLGKTELFQILLVFYVLGLIFALVSLYWKISLHAGVNATLFTTINLFYGWRYMWLYGLLCLVMWARVYLKHHSWGQVVVGAILGGGLTWVGVGWVIG